MSVHTEAARPTLGSRRTIRVAAIIDGGVSPTHASLDLAETVVRELWENEVAVFGYRVGLIDPDDLEPDDDELAFLLVDAVSRELEAFHEERPDAGEVWDRIVRSVRSLTGDGWRITNAGAHAGPTWRMVSYR